MSDDSVELPAETIQEPSAETLTANWDIDAPRGGRALMNRFIKENSTVPLFLAQTLVQSLRDVGYNHTTSALCEHVDNAIQAGAGEIRVYFRQTGKRGNYQIDVAVYDDGSGMSPAVLKVGMAFGGSLNFGKRDGIARFGMGMKTAALSMSPVLEVYSWQEPQAIYNMTLDLDAIGRDKKTLVELPDPRLVTELPDEISTILTEPMSFPISREEQVLLATDEKSLVGRLGSSGTIVFMPSCDRLMFRKAKSLVDHAVREMSRVYRRQIAGGLKLYVNNRVVEAFDPTYSMQNAWHERFIEVGPKHSRLVVARPIDIPVHEHSSETEKIQVKIFKLPIESWSTFTRTTLKNSLRVFEGLTVSILRNDRELFAGTMSKLTTRHSVTHWYRVQIDFPGKLDEAFGVASNKQGVRPKGYVEEKIIAAIGDDITRLNDEIREFQAAEKVKREPSKPTASEAKAAEADMFQANDLPGLTPEEQLQLEGNLRGLATTLKRPDETDEQAYERVRDSKYIINLKPEKYWPFYDVTHRFGRVILTINTAHPFFSQLYEPVSKLLPSNPSEDDDGLPVHQTEEHGPAMALDLLLLSLARTQSRLARTGEEAERLIDLLRREWSESYRVQLS